LADSRFVIHASGGLFGDAHGPVTGDARRRWSLALRRV